jgi:hypothetical protein
LIAAAYDRAIALRLIRRSSVAPTGDARRRARQCRELGEPLTASEYRHADTSLEQSAKVAAHSSPNDHDTSAIKNREPPMRTRSSTGDASNIGSAAAPHVAINRSTVPGSRSKRRAISP